MAKSLGQIHTLNYTFTDITADGSKYHMDLSGELSSQLQRLVRQGQIFKVCGIDMQVTEFGGQPDAGGQISGRIQYYAPTKGRCKAYNDAYKAMREAMRLQGVKPSLNKQYDFRMIMRPESEYENTPIVNLATLDGTHELVATGSVDENTNVFDVYNRSVQPITADDTPAGELFPAGFNTFGVQNTPTDFVLNDGLLWEGNSWIADLEKEFIPFQLSYTPGSTDVAFTLEWRPDPALYLAILAGQMEIVIDELDKDTGADALKLEVAVMVAGWKSFVGSKKTGRKFRRRSTRKSRKSRKRWIGGGKNF